MREELITRDQFEKEITKLLLRGLPDLPKSPRSQAVLLKSVMLSIGPLSAVGEQEVNERLGEWETAVAAERLPDHVTLRRGLVDLGFLNRSSDGSSYDVNPAGPRAWQFEPSVDDVDVPALLAEARAEAERRKQAYLNK